MYPSIRLINELIRKEPAMLIRKLLGLDYHSRCLVCWICKNDSSAKKSVVSLVSSEHYE
jgi:hypothetical protein